MSENIQELEFKEHVRKRPWMYLGGSGSKGIVGLIKGLISNCIEVTQSQSYFFRLTIEQEFYFHLDIEGSDEIFKFKETLMGMKNSLSYLKVCEALSNEFKLEIKTERVIQLKFRLEKSVFSESVDYLELTETLLQFAFLNRNSEILLIDNRDKYPNQNYFTFPEGIKYVYDRLIKEAIGKPAFEIYFDGELNELKYQIYLGYRTDWYPSPSIAMFANDVHNTCGGSLLDGIMEGIINGCRQYVKTIDSVNYKIRKKKFNNGLILTASVRGKDFKYGGSFKESLEDEQVKKEMNKLIKSLTIGFFESNKEKADEFLWRFDETQLTSGIY